MKPVVSLDNRLTDAEYAQVKSNFENSETSLSKFTVSLSDEERLAVRNVSEGREGYVKETLRIALQFKDQIPTSISIEEFEELYRQFDRFRALLVLSEKVTEKIDDTCVGMGKDLMRFVDPIYAILQTMRNTNAHLDRALNRLDEYNSKFGSRPGNGSGKPASTEPEDLPPIS